MSSNNASQNDPLEIIYLRNFLLNGQRRTFNIKGTLLFVLCHAAVIGGGFAGYSLINKGAIPNLSIKPTNSDTSVSDVEESYSMSVSVSSVTLNLDDDGTATLDVTVDNPDKSFNLNYDYSNYITIEEVSNSNGKITYELVPKTIGTGYIEFKLVDINDDSIVYDTKRISLTVEGTLDYGYFNNHAYQVFNDSMTWTDAKSACENQGGHLVTIESAEEQTYIQKIIKSSKKENLWMGGVYSISNAVWTWVDNTPWDYTNWDFSQPDNYTGDEYYLQIKNRDRIYDDWEAYDGKWNDMADIPDGSDSNADAPIELFGYVCEWDYIETTIIGYRIRKVTMHRQKLQIALITLTHLTEHFLLHFPEEIRVE